MSEILLRVRDTNTQETYDPYFELKNVDGNDYAVMSMNINQPRAISFFEDEIDNNGTPLTFAYPTLSISVTNKSKGVSAPNLMVSLDSGSTYGTIEPGESLVFDVSRNSIIIKSESESLPARYRVSYGFR